MRTIASTDSCKFTCTYLHILRTMDSEICMQMLEHVNILVCTLAVLSQLRKSRRTKYAAAVRKAFPQSTSYPRPAWKKRNVLQRQRKANKIRNRRGPNRLCFVFHFKRWVVLWYALQQLAYIYSQLAAMHTAVASTAVHHWIRHRTSITLSYISINLYCRPFYMYMSAFPRAVRCEPIEPSDARNRIDGIL